MTERMSIHDYIEKRRAEIEELGKKWRFFVPVRQEAATGHVILRAESGGGFWVEIPGSQQVPMDELDIRAAESSEAELWVIEAAAHEAGYLEDWVEANEKLTAEQKRVLLVTVRRLQEPLAALTETEE